MAATGIPLVNALVTMRCVTQATNSFRTGSNGTFAVFASPAAFPCALRVEGSGSQTGEIYHSVALAPGVANITPLTDAILTLLAEDKPSAFFDQLTDAQIRTATRGALDAAILELKSLLPPSIKLPQGRDPFSSSFEANGIDELDTVLDAIRAAMRSSALSWNDVLELLLTDEPIDTTAPALTSLSPAIAPIDAIVTVSGRNFPTVPVPVIELVMSDGRRFPAKVQPGNTSSSLRFIVPGGLASGDYAVFAGGYELPVKLFVVGAPNPSAYFPFARSGPVHGVIASRGLSNQDVGGNYGGITILYPGRTRTAQQCHVRVNADASVSELDGNGQELARYEWERLENLDNPLFPTLYASNSADYPNANRKVQVIGPTGSVPAQAFMFGSGTFKDAYRMCIRDVAESIANLQFFSTPTEANWLQAKGTYGPGGIVVYEQVPLSLPGLSSVYASLEEKTKPHYIKELNRTITARTRCTTTIDASGHVTIDFTEDGTGQGGYAFKFGDNFVYNPPIEVDDFLKPRFQLRPHFESKSNFRLLNSKPFFLSPEPTMVVDLGFITNNVRTDYVSLFYGVSNYGFEPGRFDYKGAIACNMGLTGPRWPSGTRSQSLPVWP